MANGLGSRISRLRTLIDHPGTGENERAVAQHMLDRIVLRSEADGQSIGDRAYGARHDRVGRHAGLTAVVEAIYEDIMFARVFSPPGLPAAPAVPNPIRDAPTGIVYSVDSPFDGSIVISVDDVPRDWGWVDEDGLETISPALRALIDELADIMNSYNYGGSDISKRFFGSVRVHGVTMFW
ncbi:hypothetical protein ACL02S_02000 [Nocardia sp. 004]|uniref:hypothetical protein n=1 Tax=Nocardia sp. 004 TaxID=3385978 RepID=UPI0039A1686F